MAGPTGRQAATAVGWCEAHGKLLFATRRSAKAFIRVNFHDGDGMREYRCKAVDGMYHVGHRPPAVRAGRMTVAQVYGDAS